MDEYNDYKESIEISLNQMSDKLNSLHMANGYNDTFRYIIYIIFLLFLFLL